MADYSTADTFIRVMGKLREIDPDTSEPMRHQMRRLKTIANDLIDNALRQAEQIAWQALDLPTECGAAIKDSLDKAESASKGDQAAAKGDAS